MHDITHTDVVINNKRIKGLELEGSLENSYMNTTAATTGFDQNPMAIAHFHLAGTGIDVVDEVDEDGNTSGIILVADTNTDLALLGEALTFAGDVLFNTLLKEAEEVNKEEHHHA